MITTKLEAIKYLERRAIAEDTTEEQRESFRQCVDVLRRAIKADEQLVDPDRKLYEDLLLAGILSGNNPYAAAIRAREALQYLVTEFEAYKKQKIETALLEAEQIRKRAKQ